ncbi:RUN domain-containing protein 1-like [Babylonia areolata]|uniref:RUN domain-containing protein 1-like n=1 Tax=Babylonia areolata TaxID=304850 RepID=UPI003FCFD8D3
MEDIIPTTSELSKLTVHQSKPVTDTPPLITHDLDPGAEETDAASVDYDSFDEHNHERPAERWAPLGAAVSPTPSPAEPCMLADSSEGERLRHLEEEQEQLNSSLLALTTHFAQVQFRLKQIVNAEPTDREILLKELEDFAFKGIPDVRGCHSQDAQILEEMSDREHEEKISEQREKQLKLITQLKSQLEDLETYAYELGLIGGVHVGAGTVGSISLPKLEGFSAGVPLTLAPKVDPWWLVSICIKGGSSDGPELKDVSEAEDQSELSSGRDRTCNRVTPRTVEVAVQTKRSTGTQTDGLNPSRRTVGLAWRAVSTPSHPVRRPRARWAGREKASAEARFARSRPTNPPAPSPRLCLPGPWAGGKTPWFNAECWEARRSRKEMRSDASFGRPEAFDPQQLEGEIRLFSTSWRKAHNPAAKNRGPGTQRRGEPASSNRRMKLTLNYYLKCRGSAAIAADQQRVPTLEEKTAMEEDLRSSRHSYTAQSPASGRAAEDVKEDAEAEEPEAERSTRDKPFPPPRKYAHELARSPSAFSDSHPHTPPREMERPKRSKGAHIQLCMGKLRDCVPSWRWPSTHNLELSQQQTRSSCNMECAEKACDLDSEDYTSDTDEGEQMSSPALTQCVRKELAMAIRDLMQHGLMEMGQSTSMVPLGCFPSRSADITRMMHSWDLLVKFYDMKHGREYNESPARMLSQSFHLDIVGGKPITAKQTLLGAIDTVLKAHVPHKRGEDSYFKAFICLALNERKLVTWLRLLFRTQTLIDQYYQDWSYVARTGFEDALQSLERLLVINFHLPVDLAVRPFSNIRDAF